VERCYAAQHPQSQDGVQGGSPLASGNGTPAGSKDGGAGSRGGSGGGSGSGTGTRFRGSETPEARSRSDGNDGRRGAGTSGGSTATEGGGSAIVVGAMPRKVRRGRGRGRGWRAAGRGKLPNALVV
jgi:hypothetical protein